MTAVVPVSDSTLRENPQTYFIHYKSCCDDTHLMSKKHCQQAAFNKKKGQIYARRFPRSAEEHYLYRSQ